MKATPTRTLNPLPFQDLEPHRFEDLVRQLAYEFRPWTSLEAIGRSGSDEGLDIRGVEPVPADPSGDHDGDVDEPEAVEERLWVFQCKRERAFSPKRVRDAADESLTNLATAPHGFVLAVSSDVSKKARDAFRQEMVARGVSEFFIWSRGELEDMLFQPRHDRLLFAYFGISLQQRRRSTAMDVRSEIARKKQVAALLEGHLPHGRLVLLRDPEDRRYPTDPAEGEPEPRWLLCRAISAMEPGHLVVLRHEFLAATTPDGKGWDAIGDYDLAEVMALNELAAASWAALIPDREQTARDFWNEHIAEQDKAYVKVTRSVPYARILAIDAIGDGYYPVPHVIVPFVGADGPFAPGDFAVLERAGIDGHRLELSPQPESRKLMFPQALPRPGDPPPANFDHTLDSAPRLSKSVRGRLRELVKPAEAALPRPAASVAEDAAKETASRMAAFRDWRDTVGRPTLSGFVKALREAGHQARVVIRSVEPGNRAEGFESVELRVRLHTPTPSNAPYWRPGYLRVSASPRGWTLDAQPPKPEEPRRTYGSPSPAPSPKPDGMARTQLEALVLEMVERLKGRY